VALEIIGFLRSNFVRTVRMVAQEKGVAYDHIPAMPHSDEVKAINPLGLIPVMRHDELELPESQAIAR
jgi:glutathione S-transferase